MVLYNAATKELTAKIVYYGPGLGGKTTNLQLLHDRLDPHTVGKLVTLSTQTDRTIYFDMLPVELGEIKGYKIRFQLATVPGQTAFNETRRVVLRGADGIVFVTDSRWAMLPKNLESWQNLKDNLRANGTSFETIPIVVQYNKRDLTDVLSVEAMQEALGLASYPFVEAVASAGRGITETFRLVSKLTFVDLLRRLQGRRPEDAVAASRPSLALVPPVKDKARPADPEPVAPPRPAPEPAARAEDREPFPAPQPLAPAEAAPSRWEERLAGLENRLAEASGLAHDAAERESLAKAAAETQQRLAALENRLDTEEQARRAAEKGSEAALASLSARAEKLYQEIAGVLRQVEALEAGLAENTARGEREAEGLRAQIAPLLEAREDPSLQLRVGALEVGLAEKTERGLREVEDIRAQFAPFLEALKDRGVLRQVEALEVSLAEKTAQGLREVEDIRAQIAPLLEARDERLSADRRSLAELDHLRESLADSLAEVAERLRRTVR